MHKLPLIKFDYVIVKKHSIKNDQNPVYEFPYGKVIPLSVSLYFNEILYLYSQIVGLPRVCGKIFPTS